MNTNAEINSIINDSRVYRSFDPSKHVIVTSECKDPFVLTSRPGSDQLEYLLAYLDDRIAETSHAGCQNRLIQAHDLIRSVLNYAIKGGGIRPPETSKRHIEGLNSWLQPGDESGDMSGFDKICLPQYPRIPLTNATHFQHGHPFWFDPTPEEIPENHVPGVAPAHPHECNPHQWVDTGIPGGNTWCKVCDLNYRDYLRGQPLTRVGDADAD